MRIGDVLRYPSKILPNREVVDGLPNWYYETRGVDGSGWNVARLESGINTSAMAGPYAGRIPFLAIRSSPHRFGSRETPWEDIHRPDQGFCRYFGDAKPGEKAADEYLGNQRLLEAFLLQRGDRQDRLKAPPILVFEAVPYGGRTKGQVMFHGLGVITRAELVVQRDPKSSKTFPNYAFEIALLDLADENDALDWNWINARRDGSLDHPETLALAPKAWQKWVASGPSSLLTLRRRVLTRKIVTEKMQRPPSGSREARILQSIYDYYSGNKHRFESLAEFAVSRIFSDQGITYKSGWITQMGGDGGFDFVGAIDLDPASALNSSRQVVLGQAKCEKLSKATNGLHIARLAARLRRGWIGAYVTTSYFSVPVQREILVDRYPIVLVDGYRLASVVVQYLEDYRIGLTELLDDLVANHEDRLGFGDPEVILA